MSRIEFLAGALADLDRFAQHLEQIEGENRQARMLQIVQAVDLLVDNPLIGRKVDNGRRELVIGRGTRGYVALYQFVPNIDTVFVLAIRNQREESYKR